MFKIGLLLFIFQVALVTNAGAEAISPGTHWTSIVDSLLATGIRQIGTFDIAKFRALAADKRWKAISEPPTSVQSGSRQSAANACGQNEISIVDQAPAGMSTSLPKLEVHELIGATKMPGDVCYNDHNYALSTALTILANMNDGPLRRELVAAFGKTIFRNPLRIAGGTSVSGGGDLPTLFIKDQVLRQAMGDDQNRAGATVDFLMQFPSINFEPLQGRGKSVVIQYQYIIKTRAEHFAVFLPMQRWNMGEQAQRDLVRETTRKILELFPAYSGTSLATFKPSECQSPSQRISFPSSQDINVRDIQDQRGGLLLGCRTFLPGATDLIIQAPGIKTIDEPKSAGNFYFKCTMSYGATAQSITRFKVVQGQATALSYAPWSVEPGDYLNGDLYVSAEGKILGTGITYVPPHAIHKPSKITPAQDPTASESQREVNDQTLSFRCVKER